MPSGTGKKVRIAVIASGDMKKVAQDSGADFYGDEDLIEKIKGGFTEFDVCIATPDMMTKLAPVAKILGPRGMMPNPKLGTVTTDIAQVVKSFQMGRVEYRTGKDGSIAISIGRIDFTEDQLRANILEFVKSVKAAKPASVKGNYFVGCCMATTMSGFGLDIQMSKLVS